MKGRLGSPTTIVKMTKNSWRCGKRTVGKKCSKCRSRFKLNEAMKHYYGAYAHVRCPNYSPPKRKRTNFDVPEVLKGLA